MELKRCCPASHSRYSLRINRTSVELKPIYSMWPDTRRDRINRTSVELKLLRMRQRVFLPLWINRTSVELKLFHRAAYGD